MVRIFTLPILSFLITVAAGQLLIFDANRESLATTVKYFSLGDLCGDAPVIVVARCTGISTEWDAEHDIVFTRTEFSIEEIIKGSPAAGMVMIRMPGGEYQDHRTTVAGVPRFTEGDETVLFLTEPDEHGFPWIMGLGQGCYPILSDRKTNEKRVLKGAADISLYDSETGRTLQKSAESRFQSLDAFKKEIRGFLGKRAAPRGREEL